MFLAGRGGGKTRAASETIRHLVESNQIRNIALVAETAADARDTMVELGESSIMKTARPDFMPKYEPSKRRLTWPNGAVASTFSADKPGQLRGPQHDFAWCDEMAKWRYPDETWSNLQFGLRLVGPRGMQPKAMITTTPRPTKLVLKLAKGERQMDGTYIPRPGSIVTHCHTYDNSANLADDFLLEMRTEYEGSRLGRQELAAEILDEIEGALWTLALIDENRARSEPASFQKLVIAVDPPARSKETSDSPAECGIIAVGKHDGHFYPLIDRSCYGKPVEWARAAIKTYHEFKADCIVVEINNGGDMVKHTLQSVDDSVPVRTVHASRGKAIRAEPVATLYEQGRVHHVGVMAKLEDQMSTWVPGEDSPDRLDALVWGISYLRGHSLAREIVGPSTVTLLTS